MNNTEGHWANNINQLMDFFSKDNFTSQFCIFKLRTKRHKIFQVEERGQQFNENVLFIQHIIFPQRNKHN